MVIKGKVPRWYLWRDGKVVPCYETPKKGNNGMKPYSLREARDDKALVSVTTVLQIIDKPELDNWRVSQAIQSSLTFPIPDEPYSDWVKRVFPTLEFDISANKIINSEWVVHKAYHEPPKFMHSEDELAKMILEDSEAQAAKASEFGTRIHDVISSILNPKVKVLKWEWVKDDIYPYIDSFLTWANKNIEEVHAVEKTVGHPSLGVAGRMDLDCTLKGVGRTIIDLKSQAIKDGKPMFWSDWCPQLAAYAECLSLNEKCELAHIMSIVIPSNEPGPVHTKLWTVEEQGNAMNAFHHALALWIHFRGNGYDPRQP